MANQKPVKVTSDGIKLYVEVFGNGLPFLFAHSLGACHHQARNVLESLADAFQLIIFDQRGHCQSMPVTDPALYQPRRMAADIAAILDHLGIEQAIVGGESMGRPRRCCLLRCTRSACNSWSWWHRPPETRRILGAT